MDLSSGTYYWPTPGTDFDTHAPAPGRVEGDVAVIGAGITGATVAQALARAGYRVVVIDRAHPALGSTIASTALIQYELDVSLTDLSSRIGLEDAATAYRLCVSAIGWLNDTIGGLGERCGFRLVPSLFLAKNPRSADRLARELELRRTAGIDAEWVDTDGLLGGWGIRRPGAILSKTAAQVNPVALTMRLLSDAAAHGAAVFCGTGPVRWAREGGRFTVDTEAGHTVRCPQLVVATGYESQALLQERVVDLDSTFAIATEPLAEREPWAHRSLIWDDDDPYLYVRTLDDGRLLIGGEDEPFESPALRDALINDKARIIAERFRVLVPRLSIRPQYRWAGTFGKTRDGLPYAGESPEHPGVLFALAFGGNGMTFGVIIARFLTDILRGRPPPEMHLFRFGR